MSGNAMSQTRQKMFSTLLGAQRALMSVGVSGWIRRIPFAYPVYTSLYRRWAPREEVSVEADGHKLYLDPRDMGMARAFLLFKGRWEETETQLFCSLVRPGMTVVDIGANVGYYTLLAARLAGPGGHVYAFEPSPENFRLLRRNVEANGYCNVTLVPKAVSSTRGTASLTLDRSSSGGHSLSRFRGGADSVEVETVSLDEFFPGTQPPAIDVIKMDAEGAETGILAGMKQILARNPAVTVLTEFFPRAICGFGSSPEDYVRQLAALGFRIHPIDEATGELRALDPARAAELVAELTRPGAGADVINLLCVRGASALRAKGAAR
jgi:FkbM family methyltransferase